ncbi:BTAD domain-containing putative transcriptional regulator [Streptomyces sp. WAC01280]|uniref:BTAD domain-containing putative transcriptional regulator n=1 Tax=Streptomyces sp. WAC01280 TaxID=2487424 RepID=UPI000F79E309|nr:BTAD domain-containing putative transcriptional regulator [Streptomyces sp. WAC01280]RSS53307.1 AfsR/SARP family transcriptional regulator [Streptomyces sp. WAC01280]
MRFAVLGETSVRTEDGRPVRVPELKVRALLAALLVDAGRPVSAYRLVDDLWGDEPPGSPLRALQAKVSQLRRALDEAEPGGRGLVVTRAPGYLLDVAEGALDAHRFAALAARARDTAAPRVRAELLGEALGLWRGPAFADFAAEPFARAAADRLEEERLSVRETLAETRLELGEHGVLVGELAELVARHPLRERLRAVHLRALYRAGRQSEALAGYEELRALLADELGLDPSPELAALHTAMLRQDAGLSLPAPASPAVPSAPVAAGGPARSNLPVPLSGIVGRDEAVAEVTGLLRERRLVTLTGPGGVGKTRLAVEAARRVEEEFPDGVWLVEFAGAGGELAEVAAAALELRDDGVWGLRPDGERPPTTAERLAEVLRGRRILLVLDNCEHVVDEAASLTELLLRAAPGLVVLTTSQEPLALAGETLWAVEPLDTDGAVALFTARAAASAPGLTLDAPAQEAVRGICRRLDGIPLALELAATRVRALGVHGLLERLDDRFRLLDAGLRGAPARQQTLRAVIDWSWDLLGAPERTVLRRLAVHAEGCTLAAAERVCAGEGDDVAAGDVLGLLVRLVDRSLVVAVDGPDGPRYRLLESVAAYCLERLRDAGETEAVRERHLAYYVRLAEEAEPALRGPGQRRRLAHLDAETPNLRAALDRALGPAGAAGPNAGAALRLVDALAWYWIMRGRLGEALRSATAALRHPATPELAALRARVAVWRTGLAVMGGDGTDRQRRIEEALAAYDAADADTAQGGDADAADAHVADAATSGAGDTDTDAPTTTTTETPRPWPRWFLAHALCGTGSQVEGGELTGRALDGFRADGDRWGEAAALADRSVQLLLKGDVAGAEADAARADALFAELGDACSRLWTVYPLATVAEIHGEYERADRLKRAGLAAAESFGLTTEVPDLLAGLGRTALLRGDLDACRSYHAAARDRAAEVGFRAGEINAVLGLGLGARREGLFEEAERHMREVLDWHRSVGLDSANALILAELGFSALARGDLAGALKLQEEGYGTALTSGDPRAVALALEGLASAHAPAGRARGAALLLGAAAALRSSTGAPLPPAERADVDRAEEAARTALGEAAFATAFAHGGSLPHATAVSEAAHGG